MNLGMYIINKLFHESSLIRFLFTRCVKQTHSLRSFVCFTQLVNKNRTRSLTVKYLPINLLDVSHATARIFRSDGYKRVGLSPV